MLFKKIQLLPVLILFLSSCNSPVSHDYILTLWEDDIPHSTGQFSGIDTTRKGHIRNVQVPDISVYLPPAEINTGAAVIICPGGGYWVLAIEKEGHEVAKWLNSFGVAGIVLKYRLPSSENITDIHEVAITDAQRAIRMVRGHADEWSVNANRIGIMGFSAGGHLASTALTHFDEGNMNAEDMIEKFSCRPDFGILVYPVVTMDTSFTHMGTRINLLGENPPGEMVEYFSNEKQITKDTPPTFLIHTTDDETVNVKNSISFYMGLIEHDIPAEIHVYQRGLHGFGLDRETGPVLSWPVRCQEWLMELMNSGLI